MKKLVLICLILIGCEDVQKTPAVIKKSDGSSAPIGQFFDMTYKGHVYVCNTVRDGLAISHAGHCPCKTPCK